MRRSRMLALGAVALALVSACGLGGGGKPTLKIGSVKFDEARVMAEIYGQVLEANGYTVDRAGIGLGDRPIVAPAIESGQIDLQPEYIGSRLSYELKNNPNPAIPAGIGRFSGQRCRPAAGARCQEPDRLDYTPAIDTNAFVVRADTATQFSLAKMGDMAAVQSQLKWGLATDCPTNPCVRARRRSGAVRHHRPDDRRRHAAVGVRHADGRRPEEQDRSTSPSCARPSPRSSSTAGSSSRTTSTPSRPTTSRRSCATTTWPRSTGSVQEAP